MRISRKITLSSVLLSVIFAAGIPSVAGAKTLTATLELRGIVPLFCQADVLSVTPLQTGVQLNVNHNCNGRHHAVVTFSQPEAFGSAILTYGGITRPLSGDGEVYLPAEKPVQGQRILTITGMTPTKETPIVTISLMTL
jgi:hypothetical protein